MKFKLFIILASITSKSFAQQPVSASFIATLGVDTVIVETYNRLPNHLFGKAFLRYPEDQISIFNFHFYPDGSIKHYSISYMKPDSSYATSSGTQGLYCESDSCTWYASSKIRETEYQNRRAVKNMHFIGGWTPTLSLIEWHCIRLMKSGKESLPLTMINDNIGVKQISISKGNRDTLIFGGDFLEYTKIKATPDGQIIAYDGTSTPWSYIATKHPPIDVDEVAKRMSKKPKIGNPSPRARESFFIEKDTIHLSYARPYMRGRKIFGGVVPYDSVWRTGAGSSTKINLPYDIQIGNAKIQKGEYSIYTIPGHEKWLLIFNTDLRQWPTEPNRSKDIAVIPVQARRVEQLTDQLTITIHPVTGGGNIIIKWENTEVQVPFKVIRN